MALALLGKPVAEKIYEKVLLEASLLGAVPKLSVILVGEDGASQTYVRMKAKKCEELGFKGEVITLPISTSQSELIQKIEKLNQDKNTHGILVQLPLPKHMDTHQVLKTVHPLKDVDGITAENAGLLFMGKPRLVPCTPNGILEMLHFYKIPVVGMHAVVIGRSEIVGKPVSQLLLMANATVTICHSKTENLEKITQTADILVVAMGKPETITMKYVRPGAAVVDVGIHRIEGKIVGDVSPEVAEVASSLSPVPGGVGPLTIACLMRNLVRACAFQLGKV